MTGFQRDLLFVICGLDEPSGQEIKERLETSQQRTIPNGRVYTNLDELTEQGLVEKGEHDGRTNRYVLTDEGLRVVKERHEWEQRQITNPRTGTS